MAAHHDEAERVVPSSHPDGADGPRAPQGVARRVAGVLEALLGGDPPVRFLFWDGSALGPDDVPGAVVVRSSRALARLLWAPGELGIARAYVAGDVDLEGSPFELVARLGARTRGTPHVGPRALAETVAAAVGLGALSLPPRPPDVEVRLSGVLHSLRRDASAVRHHYDVGNEFYELVLGPSMTYSCARFVTGSTSLEEAQRAKHDLVCRKLGLAERPGSRLLDVGCGWGSMALHAAERYGAHVLAVTVSPEQATYARRRVAQAGVGGRVEVRLCDYRELRGETFDAVSSIGMFEHVGTKRMGEYFATLRSLLAPRGRMLNHAISKAGGSRMHGRSFMNRYVFPDGELVDVAAVTAAMEGAGFEVRDVESLREHYSETLRAWVANLERSWDEAVRLVGEERARVWRLYMSGSAVNFDVGGIALHQVLGVVPDRDGSSGMARTRAGFGDGTV
ncbi:MAG: cyclopropane-fatty-acyl-phospholipid synthase [Actinomycetota bacterium]|nr:cyclopropane-fatty-acyl-phospholipid synthase [Actinomycetota bacterium]